MNIDFHLLRAHPHRRFNPLMREWVLVSPHRSRRPWQGQVETPAVPKLPTYEPSCYLCPSNTRAGQVRNPRYRNTFVFDNDFPALYGEVPKASMNEADLLVAASEAGHCRVICYSPRHDLSLGQLPKGALLKVIDTWCDEFVALGQQPNIRSVQIFENRGAMMGASSPHPHGQIWANSSIPSILRIELEAMQEYRAKHRKCLLCEYVHVELAAAERVVHENSHFITVVPHWAVWPFETLVFSKRHIGSLNELDTAERVSLGDALKSLTQRYDGLFGVPFPYSMGFHQRPTDGKRYPAFHAHAHFYPPLLRSASVRKFMVGYEMLCMPQRDITAEEAAARLRSV
jgi:UDPglucose--hexose-1-phosphate uridylyltransferase